ncbi:hypothetical protein HGB24_03260, partial [Candidatus Saccharibacteria bacterium]|nr:hypothetical protein [Candidatus Saccharibacteria bacterium]
TQATIPYGIYYWRARGQDPNGSNSYGEWSSTYSLTISLGGGIKVWDGNSWTMKPVKVWDGNSWVTKPLKVWTGSSWELK